MNCPGCAAPMTEHALGGHVGTTVIIDVCLPCQAFWFDGHESLRLTPASTLRLFRIIGDQAAEARHPLPNKSTCPRCASALVLTHDQQRATRFQYRRCPKAHGRFMTFFDFLRQKDFIRPLSGAQLEDLRAHVQTVNCSNCGAPVDLAHASTCAHCQSPLSMLDIRQADEIIAGLRDAEKQNAGIGASVDPAMPLSLERARRDVEQAFSQFERSPSWYHDASTAGTVGAGLMALGRWLRQKI